MVGCRVYNSTDLNISDDSTTILTFDSERFDTDSMHDAGNPSRITINTAGKYMIGATLAWATPATGGRARAFFLISNTTYVAQFQDELVATSQDSWTPVTFYDLAVADYIEIEVYQTCLTPQTLAVTNQSNVSPEFWAVRIGA